MKKLLASLVVFSFLLVGCGGSSSEEFEVALVTDAGDINDKSFNQSAWEAVEQYQKDHDATIKYYKPASFDDAGYKSQIEEAVENGAKIIVCPGFKFCNAIGELQDKYKDVKFILIDATPTVPDEKDSTKSNPVDPGDNVYCALYTETQPGYLAGYAAVKAGHTKLGFMGGIALPAVINYGYGYIQGANDAAKELGVTVDMMYTYTGTFNEDRPDRSPDFAYWQQSLHSLKLFSHAVVEFVTLFSLQQKKLANMQLVLIATKMMTRQVLLLLQH